MRWLRGDGSPSAFQHCRGIKPPNGIAVLVESLGYNAVTFTSAEHFLRSDVIAETRCLITDVHLPGLSGLELQEVLQSQGQLTPVIVITAYPSEKHRTRALGNGAVAGQMPDAP